MHVGVLLCACFALCRNVREARLADAAHGAAQLGERDERSVGDNIIGARFPDVPYVHQVFFWCRVDIYLSWCAWSILQWRSCGGLRALCIFV